MKLFSFELLRGGGAVIRALEGHLAVGGRADQFDRLLLGEFEVDEEGRIEHFQRGLFGLERRLRRQREMQRQQAVLVFEEVIDRLQKPLLLAVGAGKGEVAELLQRLDIGLRQRRQFLAAVDALGLGLDPLERIGREHVVKGPGVAHAGDRAVGGVDHLAFRGDPDMRMGLGRGSTQRDAAGERDAVQAGGAALISPQAAFGASSKPRRRSSASGSGSRPRKAT